MLIDSKEDLSSFDGPLHIGVLSDTHGEISTRVLGALQGSDLIVHAGDVMGQRVLDTLASVAPRVMAVGGNNDPHFRYEQGALPDAIRLAVPGGQISIVHGHQFGMRMPDHDAMRAAFSTSRIIVYGHSHHQVHDCSDAPAVLNPGAAGNTRTNGGAACARIVVRHDAGWDITLYRAA